MAETQWLLRAGRPEEARDLSALCLRSKAYWGYDDAFLRACAAELAVEPGPLLRVAEVEGRAAGVVEISVAGDLADLEKLFVDPPWIGRGLGGALLAWAVGAAREAGASGLRIEADPGAVPFYVSRGAEIVGEAPSGSIPGRNLPVLQMMF